MQSEKENKQKEKSLNCLKVGKNSSFYPSWVAFVSVRNALNENAKATTNNENMLSKYLRYNQGKNFFWTWSTRLQLKPVNTASHSNGTGSASAVDNAPKYAVNCGALNEIKLNDFSKFHDDEFTFYCVTLLRLMKQKKVQVERERLRVGVTRGQMQHFLWKNTIILFTTQNMLLK